MTVEHYFDKVDPIKKQLLGYNVTEKGYSSPRPEDVPLKAWMEEYLEPAHWSAGIDDF